MDFTQLFVEIDDFWKNVQIIYDKHLLEDGTRKRARPGRLSISEIMTILISFQTSGYRDFNSHSKLPPPEIFTVELWFAQNIELIEPPVMLHPLCPAIITKSLSVPELTENINAKKWKKVKFLKYLLTGTMYSYILC